MSMELYEVPLNLVVVLDADNAQDAHQKVRAIAAKIAENADADGYEIAPRPYIGEPEVSA